MTSKKHVFFIVDRSGSMNGGKLAAAKRGIIDNLNDVSGGKQGPLCKDDHMGLLSFDDVITLEVALNGFIDAKDKIADALDRLRPRNNTALYDAIGKGVDELCAIKANEPWIICLTDGLENASTKFGTDQEVIDYAKGRGINLRIIIIGIGSNVNHQALRNIAGSFNGQYIRSKSDPASVRTAFHQAGVAVRSGRGGNLDIPDHVEINAEEGRIGDVDPEVLARHSVQHGPVKPPKHRGHTGNQNRRQSKKSVEDEPAEHEHRPPPRMSVGPDMCRQISEDQAGLVRYVTKNCRNFMALNEGQRYDLAIPVRYIAEDGFFKLWPPIRSASALCECFLSLKNEFRELAGENIPHPYYQRETPFIKFVSDLEFGRNEGKYMKAGVNCPGIYIRGDYRTKPLPVEKKANLDLGMSAVVIEAMAYYYDCREYAVNPRSPLHRYMYSVMGLLSLPPERRERAIDKAGVAGAWGIPLYILRSMSMLPSEKVLDYLLSVLPVESLRKGINSHGNGSTNDVIDVKKLSEKLLVIRNEVGNKEEFLKVAIRLLDKLIYHRRIRYRVAGPSFTPRTFSRTNSLELRARHAGRKTSGNYDILPLGSYDAGGRNYHVFEVTDVGRPDRCHAVKARIPAGPGGKPGYQCTCEGSEFRGEKASCEHIDAVVSAMDLDDGGGSNVAGRIKESLRHEGVYH